MSEPVAMRCASSALSTGAPKVSSDGVKERRPAARLVWIPRRAFGSPEGGRRSRAGRHPHPVGEARVQAEDVRISRQAIQIALNEYQAGTQAFTTVVTAEARQLSAEESPLATQAQI